MTPDATPKPDPAAMLAAVLFLGPPLLATTVGLVADSWRWFGVTLAAMYLIELMWVAAAHFRLAAKQAKR